MKRFLALILALSLFVGGCIALVSCNGNSSNGETSDTESKSEQTSGTEQSHGTTQTEKDETTEPRESESSSASDTETSPKGSDTDGSETESAGLPDNNTVYANGDAIAEAGIDWEEGFFANVRHDVDESAAVEISASQLLEKMQVRDGEGALRDGEVYRVKETLALEGGKKYYGNGAAIIAEGGVTVKDAVDVVVKDVVILGALTVENSADLIFYKVDITADDTAVTIDAQSSDIAFKTCRIRGGSAAVKSYADGLTVYRSYVYARRGMTLVGDGVLVQDCKIFASVNAVYVSGSDCIVRENTVTAVSSGAGVTVGSGSVNTLVALNEILNIQASITVTEAYNCSIIMNRVISVCVEDTTNVYIVDNNVGGYIRLVSNDYVICDGNITPYDGLDHTLMKLNNTNVNGNGLTDVDSRVEYGANEEILPHTNKDLFVGMDRKTTVNDAAIPSKKNLGAYIEERAKSDSVVIVPPGAYSMSGSLTVNSSHNGDTIYAYGVYQEYSETDFTQYSGPQLYVNGAKNVNIYGITVGYSLPSSGQVRVVEKFIVGKEHMLRVVADAGFMDGFTYTDPQIYHTWWPEIFLLDENGELNPYPSENPKSYHSAKYSYDEDGNYDGTILITLKDRGDNPFDEHKSASQLYDRIEVGSLLTCRLGSSNKSTVQISSASNIKFRDTVIYGYAGALSVASGYGSSNISFERHHNATHSASLIDKDIYDKYTALEEKWGVDFEVYEETLADGTVRYRGAASRSGSVDAFHISQNENGVSVTSALLEGMVDDGSNQRGSSSRLHSIVNNGDGTTTIYYKPLVTEVYWDNSTSLPKNQLSTQACGNFDEGDIIFIYTPEGKIVCETPVLTSSEYQSKLLVYDLTYNGVQKVVEKTWYAVKVKTEDVDFTALINPNTGKSYDLSDNGYEITNRVTVDNLSGNSCIYTMDNVMVQNGHSRGFVIKSTHVTIKNCTFRNVNNSALLITVEPEWGESSIARNISIQQCLFDNTGYAFNATQNPAYCCIRIEGTSSVPSEDTLPLNNISITGCKFTNNEQKLAIQVNSAKNVTIKNNVFDPIVNESNRTKGIAVLVNVAMNVEISDNTYNFAHFEGNVKNVVIARNYLNVFGTDVTDENGAPIFPDPAN